MLRSGRRLRERETIRHGEKEERILTQLSSNRKRHYALSRSRKGGRDGDDETRGWGDRETRREDAHGFEPGSLCRTAEMRRARENRGLIEEEAPKGSDETH